MVTVMRFLPDTLRDALWRPIALATPDAGVYVEIIAPDVRFAAIALLTVAALAFALLRGSRLSATWLLLGFVSLAFIPWLATTGNGRYFIAVLLLAGPVCIGLIHQLPVTPAFRVTAAALVLGLQSFVLVQSNPFGSWALAPWKESYFPMTLTRQELEEPSTYVTMSSISYSLIAPKFDARSRWISVASLHGDPQNSLDDRRAQQFLERSTADGRPLKLVVPTIPAYMDSHLQPDQAIRAEINRTLVQHRLTLGGSTACRLVESRGLAMMTLGRLDNVSPATVAKLGFWICPLEYPVARPAPQAPSAASGRATEVFGTLEAKCPRLFRSGESANVRVGDAYSRTYPSSDIKAYVLDSGEVLYKYWRGLNPQHIGTVESVLADGFSMDCNRVRGRSGLPWEREL